MGSVRKVLPFCKNDVSLGSKGLTASFCDEGKARLKELGITTNMHLKTGRDRVWVASFVKGKSVAVHKRLKPAPQGAKYTFSDGNPLNLRLENIVVTMPEPTVQKQLKPRVKRDRPEKLITIEQASDWLEEEFELDGRPEPVTIFQLMRDEIGSKLHNDELREEVLGICSLEVIQQVTDGLCFSVNKRQFAKWCLRISEIQAGKRMRGVTEGFIGDYEEDRNAVKIRKRQRDGKTDPSFNFGSVETDGETGETYVEPKLPLGAHVGSCEEQFGFKEKD